jgi:hypothetical protein
MDDLLWLLTDWLEEHTNDFQEDYELIFDTGVVELEEVVDELRLV